ncbi:MAG: glycosyltransferase family 2 protein [Candidatus Omnitrophica bacterium]|nr:glycosyltransferase family 2 protein [Candidatus Omnitrophota bacterium]
MKSLTIIIPVHNEENAIKSVVQELLEVKKRLLVDTDIQAIEILIINDASTDKSAEIISSFKEIRLISLAVRHGYGGALKTGFANARGDLIAFLDGDRTYPASSLIHLYQELLTRGVSCVIGSRFLAKDNRCNWACRSIGNKIFSTLLSFLSGRRITDATSGMRIYKKELIPSFLSLPNGFDFIIAMTFRILFDKIPFSEVGIPFYPRIGNSKLRILYDGIRFLRTICRMTMRHSLDSRS